MGIVAVLISWGGVRQVPAAEPGTVDFSVFLTERGIDRDARESLAEAAAWDATLQREAIRVLLRLRAPRTLWLGWASQAVPVDPSQPEIDDRLRLVRGRAVFVAPLTLSAEERTLAARDSLDLVRVVVGEADAAPGGAAGAAVLDVLVPQAPLAWPRWRSIDEPAACVVLPLSTRAAPRPGPPPTDGVAWPEARPALLGAAPVISFTPETPLGRLGMNYALFDTVRDSGKLERGDADAFYALVAAVRRQPDEPASPPTDIIPIIDPARRWFQSHRGDPVTISGVARQATRIMIDDPTRRAEVGADSYWELTVFVETPPLRVDGHDQQSYPVVCVVRNVPTGMPTGDRIAEAVTVVGFAFKRYGYPLADVAISSSQGDARTEDRRMETALVVGRRVIWRAGPASGPTAGWTAMTVAAIAALAGGALGALAWARSREARRAEARARATLPDRIDLPPEAP